MSAELGRTLNALVVRLPDEVPRVWVSSYCRNTLAPLQYVQDDIIFSQVSLYELEVFIRPCSINVVMFRLIDEVNADNVMSFLQSVEHDTLANIPVTSGDSDLHDGRTEQVMTGASDDGT